MAEYKFLLKPGKGLRDITATDLELITKDPSEELALLNNRIRSLDDELSNRLNRNLLVSSNTLLTIFNQTVTNNYVTYKLGYTADDKDLELRINSVQSVFNTVKHAYINSETVNKINFTPGQPAIRIIVPQGKLPSMTGYGKVAHIQTLRTSDSRNLVYISGDLDEDNSSVEPSNIDQYSLEEVTTNKTWIDGKAIFRKVFDFGTIPNSGGTYTLDHELNIDTYTSFLILVPSQGRTGMFNPESRDDSTSTSSQKFVLSSSMDNLTIGDYLILEYTKNDTDTD